MRQPWGIVFSTALASIAMLINYLGSDGVTVFTTLVLMTGITAAIPYGFSAAAQIKWRIADQKKMETPRFIRDMIVAVLSLIFSALFIYYSRDTGHSFWVYWAPFLLTAGAFLIGIPVYRSQRNKMTQPGRSPAVPVSRVATPRSRGRRRSRAVVALGGNALLRRGEPLEAENQAHAARAAAEALARAASRYQLVVTHGNGPAGGSAGADERGLHRDVALPARCPRLGDRRSDRLCA